MSIKFDFQGYNKIPSFCYIDIHKHDNCTVVVASQPGYHEDNSGTSITNAAEHIATMVCRAFGIPFGKLVWIERYPRIENIDMPERWDLVSFLVEKTPLTEFCTWEYPDGIRVLRFPRWNPITPKQAQGIIDGSKLEVMIKLPMQRG